ncbi:MAG: helix-turn-helix transcriptional regulator [Verrucomicrobiota bacterium]
MRDAVCTQVTSILHAERKKQQISMTVLAQRAGLSQSMISLVERDLRNPTLETLLRMCEVLELELSDVLVSAKKTVLKKKD